MLPKTKVQGLHAALPSFEMLLIFSLTTHTMKSLMVWFSFVMSKLMPGVVEKHFLGKYLITLGLKPSGTEGYIFLNDTFIFKCVILYE